MSATLTVPASELAKLSGAFKAIARSARVSGEAVLRGEAGIILKTCAGRTKVATQKKADQRSALSVLNKGGLDLTGSAGTQPGDITVNAGWKGPFGRVWVRSPVRRNERLGKHPARFRLAGQINKTSFSFKPERFHWKTGTWIDIVEAAADVAYQMRKAIPAGRKAIGLARQSWVQIADSLGIRLESVQGGGALSAAGLAKARSAIAATGRRYTNGLSRQERGARASITLINRYPRGRNMGMDRTLAGVLIGRVRFFQQNMRRGVFFSIANTARAYPYLTVKNTGA
jgi:hypothetical protein